MAGKLTLMAHQELALGMMAGSGGHLGVYYDMGLGKTVIALMYIYEKMQKHTGLRAIVICPASLVDSWRSAVDEMDRFEGVTPAGLDSLRKAVFITSFQRTYRTERKTVRRKGQLYSKKMHLLRPEVDCDWDIMCVDEAHGIGAHDSVQSWAAWRIALRSAERFLFTGTPVHGGGGKSDFSKLYGQMRVLHPRTWMGWGEFVRRYVTRVDQRFHKIIAYDEPACRQLMEDNAVVCRLADCVDLPGFTDISVPCPLAERKVYEDLREKDVEEYGISLNSGGSIWIRMMQVCSGSLKREGDDVLVLKTSKDDRFRELLDGNDAKLVVFCNFRASIDRVKAMCDAAGRKSIVVDGRTKDRGEWRRFATDACDTVICQYQSGGAGLNLQAASYMVFFEPTPSALLYSQARARIYRKGQDAKCVYYILTTPGTIEDKAWKAVMNGLDVTEAMLREWALEQS